MEELRRKLQTEIFKKQDVRRYYEGALMDKVKYEKTRNLAENAAIEEFQTRQEKRITELQTQLETTVKENKEIEEKLRVLQDTEETLSALTKQAEQKRTYSIIGFKIIFPF